MTDTPRRKGRGYPPVEHRWPPGKSGNPFGRPFGSKNKPKPGADGLLPNERAILEEARRLVSLADGTKIPTSNAVIRSNNVQAIKGNRLASKQALAIIAAAEAKQEAVKHKLYEQAARYKQLAQQLRRHLETSHAEGLGPYPHPDDVHLEADGTVTVHGPGSVREETQFRALETEVKWLRSAIRELRLKVQASPGDLTAHVDLLRAELLYVEAREVLPARYGVPPISALRWPRGAKIETPPEAYEQLGTKQKRPIRRTRRLS